MMPHSAREKQQEPPLIMNNFGGDIHFNFPSPAPMVNDAVLDAGPTAPSTLAPNQVLRNPNNRWGKDGTLRCEFCRKYRKGCVFDDPNDLCRECIARSRPCGPKTPCKDKLQRSGSSWPAPTPHWLPDETLLRNVAKSMGLPEAIAAQCLVSSLRRQYPHLLETPHVQLQPPYQPPQPVQSAWPLTPQAPLPYAPPQFTFQYTGGMQPQAEQHIIMTQGYQHGAQPPNPGPNVAPGLPETPHLFVQPSGTLRATPSFAMPQPQLGLFNRGNASQNQHLHPGYYDPAHYDQQMGNQ